MFILVSSREGDVCYGNCLQKLKDIAEKHCDKNRDEFIVYSINSEEFNPERKEIERYNFFEDSSITENDKRLLKALQKFFTIYYFNQKVSSKWNDQMIQWQRYNNSNDQFNYDDAKIPLDVDKIKINTSLMFVYEHRYDTDDNDAINTRKAIFKPKHMFSGKPRYSNLLFLLKELTDYIETDILKLVVEFSSSISPGGEEEKKEIQQAIDSYY